MTVTRSRSRKMARCWSVGGVLLMLLLAFSSTYTAVAAPPGNQSFQRTWERTDKPVLDGEVSRTWMWGPQANYPAMQEPYAESPGGMREVQYYDKARMEITHPDSGDPSSIWYVTNGLLVVELTTGQMQTGDATFEDRAPALVNVAGDSDDPTGPQYATFGGLLDAAPNAVGATITARVDRAGNVTEDPTLASQGVTAGYLDEVTKHAIATPFWDFMNSSGSVYEDGQLTTAKLFENPFFATGRPITEAYWANVKVAGTYKDVLMQCFERRCLTYTPGNSAGFVVEAGNVGQHYYAWRYGNETPDPAPTPTPEPDPEPEHDPATEYTFVTAWGKQYDPATAFKGASGVATDNDGNVFVVETSNHRVQKYNAQGVYLAQWGSHGTGNGQFAAPYGIAIDAANNIYVADTGNKRIQKFDGHGAYVDDWPIVDPDGVLALAPLGVAVAPNGNIYVTAESSGGGRVQIFTASGDYVTQFGESGTGTGQFMSPWGIEFDSLGQIYVLDYASSRVQKFDANGGYLAQWGGPGVGDDQFGLPYGIAIDDDDTVYIADAGQGRVKAFSTGGVYLGDPLESSVPFDLQQPFDVAVDAEDNLYIADFGQNAVVKLDPERAYQIAWFDALHGRFGLPGGITIAADGDILAADFNLAYVQRFSEAGDYLDVWGGSGAQPGMLSSPLGMEVDSRGQIYVVDRDNDRIQKFRAEGVYISQWGSSGIGDGQFDEPTDIAFDSDDNAYVVDFTLGRVQKFATDGTFLGQWGEPGSGDGQLHGPEGIAIYGEIVYIVDRMNNRIQAFDLDGGYLFQWGGTGAATGQFASPTGIAVDAHGYVYVVDGNNHRIQKFTPEGDFLATWGGLGAGNGQFNYPYDLVIDEEGNVYVTDSFNYRIQKFAPVS